MKKTLIVLALTSVVSTSAQAAFWDSWFGSKEDTAPAASAPAKQAQESAGTQTTTDAVKNVAAGLIPMLTEQLGVSKSQASGGMGALFQMAKGNLDGADFSQLSKSVPDMASLLKSAPKLDGEGLESQIGGLLSSAGETGDTLNDLVQLKSQFDALGLDADMIAKFATTAVNYLQSEDGKQTAALLKKGLSAVLGDSA